MISANNVTLRIGKKALFEDVNIKFTEGNCYGLIGANGAGKSTFLKILTGQIEPSKGDVSITPGQRLSFLEQDHFKYDDCVVLDTVIRGNERLYEIMKEKEAIYAKEDFTEEDGNKASELEAEFADMNGWEAESDAAQLLNGLGITTDLHYKLMSELNGSEKVKVLLAKALFGNPDILLLDEPTNHLDSEAIEWLEVFLKQYKGTVILISHDRYFLDQVVNRIFEIHNKKLKTYNGNYSDFIKASAIEKELELKKFEDQQKDIKKQEESIERLKAFGREKHLKRARSKEKALAKVDVLDKPEAYRKKAKIEFNPSVTSGNDVLQLRDISMGYGERILFKDLNLDIYRGEKVALIGANGIGKSTLFKIIMNEITPLSGDIKFGTNVNVSYFHQEQKTLNLDNTIIDEIWEDNKQLTQTSLRTMLGAFLFEGEEVFKKISTLSGGERARVAILKLILSNANLLLLDEPTNHLDIDSKEVLEEALSSYTGTIFTISHDRYFLNTVVDKVLVLDENGITEYLGNYDYYIEKKKQVQEMNTVEVIEEKTKTQLKEEKRKEREQREAEKKNRVKRQNIEKEIEETEAKIEEMDVLLCQEEVYSNPEKSKDVSLQKASLEEKLSALYEEWESLM